MEDKILCSECELPVTKYNQVKPPEGRKDLCEFCYIVEKGILLEEG